MGREKIIENLHISKKKDSGEECFFQIKVIGKNNILNYDWIIWSWSELSESNVSKCHINVLKQDI